MSNLMSEYNNLLLSSRDIAKELGSLNIYPDQNLTEALEVGVGKSKISIWSIFEVIIAIHFLPDPKSNKLKNFVRLARSYSINYYYALKDAFNNKPEALKNHFEPGNVFFLGFTGYLAYENFDLILDEMLKDNKCNPIWINDEDASKQTRNIEHINVKAISNKKIRANALKIEKDINKKINNIVKAIKPKIYDNPKLGLLMLTIEYIKPLIKNNIARDISIADHILNNYKPSSVISIDVADPRNRIYTLLANRLDIPVIQIQAGAINQECIEWSFCYDDLMLSHGPHVKQELVKLGFNKNKVIETGSTKIEKSLNLIQSQKTILRNRFNISENKILILFLTSYVDLFDTQKILNTQKRVYKDIYSSVINEVKKSQNISLVIKPHPLEKPHQLKEHKKISSSIDNIYISNHRDNSSEMIAGSDVVVSYGSTATIDAIVLGKAVICPKFDDFVLNKYIEDSNSVLIPKNIKELSNIFEIINQGKMFEIKKQCKSGRDIFLKDLTNLNSSPTKKIVSCIYETSRNL